MLIGGGPTLQELVKVIPITAVIKMMEKARQKVKFFLNMLMCKSSAVGTIP
jgi:hypothetical protein